MRSLRATHPHIRPLAIAIQLALLPMLLGVFQPSISVPAVLAQSTNEAMSLLWNIPEQQFTQSLAQDDINGDGDLDIIFGNNGYASRIYYNCTVPANDDGCANGAPFVPSIWAPLRAHTTSLALGDINGDGRPDLVVGNNNVIWEDNSVDPTQIYLNNNGAFSNTPSAILPAINTTSIALGDVNGDGRLDLVRGNEGAASQIFLNTGSGFAAPASWTAPSSAQTKSVALGDVDDDGDLDLVLGNNGGALLYKNGCDPNPTGTCSAPATFTNTGGDPSSSAPINAVALGDLNGDGKLDLLLGNNGSPQIFFNTGSGFAAAAIWSSAPSGITTHSVTLGDVDGDGDLDITLGNEGASQLYVNNCDPHSDASCSATIIDFTPELTWKPSDSASTYAIAWSDLDGDGNLDLILGNNGQFSQIYRNQLLVLLPSTILIDETQNVSERHVALGDYDNDGLIDIALTSNGDTSQIFHNNGTGFSVLAKPLATTAKAKAVAWGDVNNDGYLDLVIGNDNQPSQLFINDKKGNLALDTTWKPATSEAYGVAWADINHDGFLDLVLGNRYDSSHKELPPSQIFLNDKKGHLDLATSWSPIADDPTMTVAWGDLNNDGDLDLVVGNSSTAPSRLYRNCTYPDKGIVCGAGTLLTLDITWNPLPADTRSVAWGDVNGDGYTDLAVGNFNNPNQIYLNDSKGKLTIDASWQPAPAATQRLAWGDMDGDQDLDLLVGNVGQPKQIYRNDGKGRLALLSSSLESAQTNDVAWGDMNGDGTLDAVFANAVPPDFTPAPPDSQIVLNTRRVGRKAINAGLIKSGPKVTIDQPEMGGRGAALLATANVLSSTIIPIHYTLSDNERDPVAAVTGFYSLDGGGTWQVAATSNITATRNLTTAPTGAAHTFLWDTFASCFFGQSDTVLFQIRASPMPLDPSALPGATSCASSHPSLIANAYLYTGQVSGSVQRPFASASTNLFRARGAQIHVQLSTGAGAKPTPAKGARVYRVPKGQEHGDLLASADGQPFLTDSAGYLAGRASLAEKDNIFALMPLTLLDTSPLQGKVDLYYTSPISITNGQPNDRVTRGTLGVQELTVSPSNPLILFNLTVGLEWDASNDPQYLSQLEYNLRRVSEQLYDWTDGQAALGELKITYGADKLNDADIRIYATNRLRPWAIQGGLVSQSITETITLGTSTKTVGYNPGHLSMGAVWTRYGDSVSFGDDWPRALAHELGHYALFLDDNYIGRDSSKQMINITTCSGAMSNPYRDDYTEFQPDASWLPGCQETLSNVETGRSDWATIQHFYNQNSLVLPLSQAFQVSQPKKFDANPGPSNQMLNFTQPILPNVTQPSSALSAPIFSLVQVPDELKPTVTTRYSYTPGSRVRAVLYTDGGKRIVDLGRPTQDQVLARGAKLNDQICIYDSTNALAGCANATLGVSQITLHKQTGWQPNIQINPLSQTQIEVVVPARGVVPPSGAAPKLTLTFFSDTLATPVLTTTLTSNGSAPYSHTFNLSAPALAGYVRLSTTSDVTNPSWREAVTEFRVSGRPSVAVKLSEDEACPPKPRKCAPLATSTDGQMLIFGDELGDDQFYSLQTATALPQAPAWGIVAGQAYRLYTKMTATDLETSHVAITAAYLESELPAGTEGGLAIYYSADGISAWQRLPTNRFDPDRNEISVAAVGAGLYALISRVEVQAGWNNISYPWPDTLPVLSATGKLNINPGQHFTTIHSYEQQEIVDPWKVYDVDAPYWVNDLKQLGYGKGYWFIVPAGGGTPALRSASNLAGGAPVPPATFYGVLPYHGVIADLNQEVQALSGTKVCNRAISVAGENHLTYRVPVDPTKPNGVQQTVFLVQVLPAGQGAPTGCGIYGQPVTIAVGGKEIGHAIWDNTRPITFRDLYLPLIFGPPAPAPANTLVSTDS